MILTLALAMATSFANDLSGWGLWWTWDPVENMVLLVWLLESALLHAVCYSSRHRGFLSFVVMLSIIIFLLCLTLSFLIHSNIVTSIHYFSPDGASAFPFLVVLATNGILGIGLAVIRKHIFLKSDPWVSYSSAHIMLHGIVIFIMMAFVLVLGLLYPIWVGVIRETTLWIGPPYYNQMFAFFMVPMVGLMVWHVIIEKMGKYELFPAVYGALTLLVFVVTGFLWPSALGWGYVFCSILFASGLAFVLAIGCHVYKTGWRYLIDHGAMISAHLGVWFLIIGAYCSTSLIQSGEIVLPIGASVNVGDVSLTAERSYFKRGDNYVSEVLDVQVESPSGVNRHMHPEMRTYDVTKDTTSVVITEQIGLYNLRLILSRHHHAGRSVLWFWVPYAFFVPLGGCLLLVGTCWASIVACYKRFYLIKERACE